MDAKIAQFAGMLKNSKRCQVFTGAGISTLSGIPDFRSADGIYSKAFQGYDVETILSLDFFRRRPDIFYKWSKTFVYNVDSYEPNIVHSTLARLENAGIVRNIYTQNIDQLHTKAGSRFVHEIHGSAAHHRCLECGAEFSYADIAPLVLADQLPRCFRCGGLVKPDIVFYGENLDETLLEQGFSDMRSADMVLVLGSSLVVQPAASLPFTAANYGASVVIVNAQPTALDQYAALCFDDLGSVFTELAALGF